MRQVTGGAMNEGAGHRPEYCQGCTRARRGNEYRCPACGCATYDSSVPGDLVAPELDLDADPAFGVLGQVLGGVWPAGMVGAIYGPKGIGKSSLAMLLFRRATYLTTEMMPQLVTSYANRLDAKLHRIAVPAWHGDEYELGLDVDQDLDLVLDSLSRTPYPQDVLDTVIGFCRTYGGRALMILHTTKAGKASGTESLLHDVDRVVRVDAHGTFRRLVIEKDRAGFSGELLFELDGDGPRLPRWGARYYSVEGHAPGFYLQPYPSAHHGRYSGRLRAAAAAGGPDHELPDAPVALAALDGGRLYPGRWVEPNDGEARRDFALAHGLPYFEAGGELHRPSSPASAGTDVPPEVTNGDVD